MSTPTAYQRIGNVASNPADYDWQSFPLHLRYDGVDDSLSTASIDFSSADKMSVVAGVRKLSDAAQGIFCELSTAVASNAGSFNIQAPGSTGNNYDVRSRGDAALPVSAIGNVAAPSTRILTMLSDIAGDSLDLRLNGSSVSTSSGDQGAGNFGNYPLYIGSRSGSLRFNGRLHGLLVIGRALTATEITNMETWMNQRTRAF